jgi:hypothetical protein
MLSTIWLVMGSCLPFLGKWQQGEEIAQYYTDVEFVSWTLPLSEAALIKVHILIMNCIPLAAPTLMWCCMRRLPQHNTAMGLSNSQHTISQPLLKLRRLVVFAIRTLITLRGGSSHPGLVHETMFKAEEAILAAISAIVTAAADQQRIPNC